MTLLRTYAPERRNDIQENRISEFLDRLFNEEVLDTQSDFSVPPANVIETDNHYRIELAVPGYEKSDFDIKLDENILTISLKNNDEKVAQKDEEYLRREFGYDQFSRCFRLSDRVTRKDISARYKNGVLSITIPKKEEHKNRSIEVS
jgi:HSP20 family protein